MSLDIEGGRGVTSLATEPSFYGMFCVFFLLLNYVYNHGDIWLLLTTIFQVVFLARSIIAIVFLGILCLFYLAMYISFRRLAILFLIFGAIYYAISISLEYSDLRAFYIIKALVDDPSQLLEIDTSVNARVNHILFSMAGFFDSYSLPHGYDAFYEFVEQATAANTFNIEWLGALHENMKIMSGYGAAFFELGLIAILIPVSITMSIFRYFERDAKRAVLPAIFINVMLFSAVQLSLPIIGLLLASLSCYAENYHADCRNPAGIG